MRKQYLKPLTSALSDAFLEIRSQSMISFDIKGVCKFSPRYMNRSGYLCQWSKEIDTEVFTSELKSLSFIKFSPELRNFTYRNFVKINHIMLKRIVCMSLFALFVLPLVAQSDMRKVASADSLYEFRFKPRNDMFFRIFKKNETQLKALFDFVDCHRSVIEAGILPLYIDGYCRSMNTAEENLRIAKTRANRVKSELIVRKRLTENCFITKNHVSDGEFVTVRIIVPTCDTAAAEKNVVVEAEAMPVAEANSYNEGAVLPEKFETVGTDITTVPIPCSGNGIPKLALCANLLRWATLTPDLGIEWRINHRISVLANGSWTSWSWDNKSRRYAFWKVSPEVRYYIGKEKRGFLGVMYHIGEFNYKLGEMGKQGDYQGGGITGGYMLQLNRSLSLDFHTAVGYTRAEYDKYKVIDNVRVHQGNADKNYWGINQLGVTLVWKLIK